MASSTTPPSVSSAAVSESLPFLPPARQAAYAIGQLGWSILLNIIGLTLVYFYLPPANAGLPTLISDRTFLVVVNAITILAAVGRLWDAITDPIIASRSDRSTNPRGRRIPFMAWSALPAAILLVLMFVPIVRAVSPWNIAWLFVVQTLFYLFITMYITPYSALMPELGHTANQRLNLATWVSITYALGIAVAAQTPVLANSVQSLFGVTDRVLALQIAISILAALATLMMYVPVFFVDERRYTQATPTSTPLIPALQRTFANRHFLFYVVADMTYFTSVTIVNTGLLYYATVLLGLDEAVVGTLLLLLIVVSFACYPFVNMVARRTGKKALIVVALIALSLVFVGISQLGRFPLPPMTQALLMVVLYAIPLAPMSVLPNAVLGDIAEEDARRTGVRQEGMYFGARTLLQKMGITLGIIIFAGLTAFGRDPGDDLGIRLSALVGFAFCLIAGLVFLRYDEKGVLGRTRPGKPDAAPSESQVP
jgi:GPH family glycoside/pentoside/hexuronide:cation symporter